MFENRENGGFFARRPRRSPPQTLRWFAAGTRLGKKRGALRDASGFSAVTAAGRRKKAASIFRQA